RLGLVGHRFDGRNADRTLLARLEEAGNQLLPFEAFARAVLLDHHVGDLVDAFVTGETAAAVETLTPAADGFALLALARVHDFVAKMAAERALHWFAPTPS